MKIMWKPKEILCVISSLDCLIPVTQLGQQKADMITPS